MFGGIHRVDFGVDGWASCWASGWLDLHGRLLSVREMLFWLSYTLVFPSTPSGTLTMLRLASPLPVKYIIYRMFVGLGRVTGGVCALQGRFQRNALFSAYC